MVGGFPGWPAMAGMPILQLVPEKKGWRNITVMPNHLSLAEKFAISDNFYVDQMYPLMDTAGLFALIPMNGWR
ncbi:MAG: hypothetical protein HC831_25315 [Chloroflexia bacterium]|nr:hypothetical protein [Chloroflexia bacterium]